MTTTKHLPDLCEVERIESVFTFLFTAVNNNTVVPSVIRHWLKPLQDPRLVPKKGMAELVIQVTWFPIFPSKESEIARAEKNCGKQSKEKKNNQ